MGVHGLKLNYNNITNRPEKPPPVEAITNVWSMVGGKIEGSVWGRFGVGLVYYRLSIGYHYQSFIGYNVCYTKKLPLITYRSVIGSERMGNPSMIYHPAGKDKLIDVFQKCFRYLETHNIYIYTYMGKL